MIHLEQVINLIRDGWFEESCILSTQLKIQELEMKDLLKKRMSHIITKIDSLFEKAV